MTPTYHYDDDTLTLTIPGELLREVARVAGIDDGKHPAVVQLRLVESQDVATVVVEVA